MALNPDTTCLYRATIVSGGRCLVIVETPASLAAHLLVTNPDAKAQGAVIAYDGRHGSKNRQILLQGSTQHPQSTTAAASNQAGIDSDECSTDDGQQQQRQQQQRAGHPRPSRGSSLPVVHHRIPIAALQLLIHTLHQHPLHASHPAHRHSLVRALVSHASPQLVDGLLLVPRGARLVFDWIVLEDSYLGKQDEATGSANMLCRLLALASPALNNASSPVLLSSPTLLFLRTTYSIQHSSCRHSAAKSARTDDGQTSTVLSIVQRWSRASSFSLERSAALTSHFRFFVHTVQDLLTRWSPRQNSICLAIPSRTSDSQPPADDDMPAGRVTGGSRHRRPRLV
ncbi:hypothetical protein A4X06_0g3829 [Tilletia controversa]|uniref:Uncharacterized protein n=1 Tax=Tilletia controversa TaxID=13291 RepID=A0A8X7MU02_9BASI|nr:hypothetical protein A4X06_0g3829 [Tilletia controversa]